MVVRRQREIMKRLVLFLLIVFSCLHPAFGSTINTQFLKKSDLIRTESAANAAAIASTQKPSGTYQPYGKVLELTRAHADSGKVKRGDWVWLVSIANSGASDINPIPDYLVWVRAKDGVVIPLLPSNYAIKGTSVETWHSSELSSGASVPYLGC